MLATAPRAESCAAACSACSLVGSSLRRRRRLSRRSSAPARAGPAAARPKRAHPRPTSRGTCVRHRRTDRRTRGFCTITQKRCRLTTPCARCWPRARAPSPGCGATGAASALCHSTRVAAACEPSARVRASHFIACASPIVLGGTLPLLPAPCAPGESMDKHHPPGKTLSCRSVRGGWCKYVLAPGPSTNTCTLNGSVVGLAPR